MRPELGADEGGELSRGSRKEASSDVEEPEARATDEWPAAPARAPAPNEPPPRATDDKPAPCVRLGSGSRRTCAPVENADGDEPNSALRRAPSDGRVEAGARMIGSTPFVPPTISCRVPKNLCTKNQTANRISKYRVVIN